MSDSDFLIKTRYECKYCHQLFATTKHDCKWNPCKKNCLTCEHCVGFDKGRGNIYDSGSLGFVDHESSYFRCDVDSDCNELEIIRSDNWNGYCDQYKQASCDNFKHRYALIMEEQRNEEDDNWRAERDTMFWF